MVPFPLLATALAATVLAADPPSGHSASATVVSRAEAPEIDGRDSDPIWAKATPITDFRQYVPVEDGAPSLRTEARVAYDERNLYVFVRAHDPRPDSIVSLLARRDVWTASDRLHVLIDSYHDRRSGFEFSVNPAGVKIDAVIINDTQEDGAWDGVWDAATRIDSLGWVAEFRIPFSQLRFAPGEELTFGLAVLRDVARSGERISWPVLRRTRPGIASQFAELRGLRGVGASRRMEVSPYAIARDRSRPVTGGRFSRAQDMTAGFDAKLGITSGLTIDASVNPDFGQVEADPSVLNLTAFEPILQERRPLFLEGAGLFRYDITCGGPACNGLFYSRRIGRAPQLAALYGDPDSPTATRILGATKLTGRTGGGLAVGVLGAVTAREVGRDERTIEPQTNYGVLRLQQDWRKGLSTAGVMVTGTQRSLDEWTRDYLREGAYVAGVDTRHRIFSGNYQVRAYAAASHVTGSAPALLRTQLSMPHAYQRPDDGIPLDSAATSLDGAVVAASFSKVGGGVLRYGTAYRYTSSGFEPNDVGFLSRADYQALQNSLGFQFSKPTRFYRQAVLNFYGYGQWNSSGQRLGWQATAQSSIQLPNQFWLNHLVQVDGIGRAVDDRLTRGGPAVRRDPRVLMSLALQGDERRAVVPIWQMRGQLRDASGSWSLGVDPEVLLRPSGRIQSTIGVSYLRGVEAQQWAGKYTDEAERSHYTVARLEQSVASLTARFDVAATPTLTLQLYAAPFVATGHNSDWREVSNPRAGRTADRFHPFTARGDAAQLDFNVKEFRLSAVARWEYRPGSTLFFVWTQGRDQAGADNGVFNAGRDFTNIFRMRPDNTFLIKASYRLGT